MKILFYSIFAILCCLIFLQCSNELNSLSGIEQTELSSDAKVKYERMLKKEVDVLISKRGYIKDCFLTTHGLPLWENAKWVNINSKNMLVIPLLSKTKSKCIIGVVVNGKIVAVVTHTLETKSADNKIFSLDNRILYASNQITSFVTRIKTRTEYTEKIEEITENLILKGGNAEDLFKAANSSDTTYDPCSKAGKLSLCATSEGNPSSSNTSGHAWIEFTDNSGNVTTFGTWGNRGDTEFLVNEEKKQGVPVHHIPLILVMNNSKKY